MKERQMCDMCGSYIAKTFLDLKGKRIYLCQQDSNTLLRVIAKETPDAFETNYNNMAELVYGKELDLTPQTDTVQPLNQPAPAIV